MSKISRAALGVTLLAGLLCGMIAFGQHATTSFRIDVDLVLLTATVTNAANRNVSGLRQEHFQVWEDKIEQQIEYFSAEDAALSVAIVFDTSGSMADKLAQARAAASTFLRMGDRDDEYLLIEFNDSARIAQDFTKDITKLQDRLLATNAKGNTALFDAMYLGLEKVRRGQNSRKAVLLITDGEDNRSRYTFSDVKELAKENDALIYTIGIIDQASWGVPVGIGRHVLEHLAGLTGGVAFFPNSAHSLEGICTRIGLDLKNQYVLGYRPLNESRDGKWRKVRVKIKKPAGMAAMTVRARSGYYAPMAANALK
jgi:Ca-activated chloride channel family protein